MILTCRGINIQKNLQDILGLTKNEARVYQTIIETSQLEPNEIAQITGLPRARIYEMMTKLAAKDLLEKRPDVGYRLIPPSEAIPNLSEQLDLDYQQRKRSLHEFGAYLQNIWVKNLASNLSPGVEVYFYKDAESFFHEHLMNVKNRVFIAVASDSAPINHRKAGTTLAQAYNEQLSVKYLVHSEKLANQLRSAFDHFAPYKDLRIKIGHNKKLYTSFVILDNIIYVYFFGSTSPIETMVLRTASPELIKSFEWMFDELWEQGSQI
ncbi:MAG: TrmB family transcriptional regulator [Candidatus Kariarchaeaceae archaeon]